MRSFLLLASLFPDLLLILELNIRNRLRLNFRFAKMNAYDFYLFIVSFVSRLIVTRLSDTFDFNNNNNTNKINKVCAVSHCYGFSFTY